MQLEIISPEKTMFEGSAKLVQLPGSDGSFEIMENHAPIISTLKKGKIKIISESNQTEFIEINGGVIEMMKNKIIILAEPSKN
jgi:F-type H+-transporting ATPase subunit epsilon